MALLITAGAGTSPVAAQVPVRLAPPPAARSTGPTGIADAGLIAAAPAGRLDDAPRQALPAAHPLQPETWALAASGVAPVPPLPDLETPPPSRLVAASRRPAPLVPLYVSFAALQVADTVSTQRALLDGGREANPVVKGFADNGAAMIAVKAGATAGTFYLTERLWKKNRVAAVVLMTALNATYAAIVAHNYRNASQR